MVDTVEAPKPNIAMKRALLLLSCIVLAIGNCGGPQIMRLYFVHGGKRVWLSSWVQTAGWPIMLIPLAVAYLRRRRTTQPTSEPINPTFFVKPHTFFLAASLGLIVGLDNYIYAYGVAWLPVSTSSLILSTQLAFIAVFAFLLVKQKFTPYSINAVVVLTIGASILALHTNGDRPENVSYRQYIVGFMMTVGAAVLYGFVLPSSELIFMKSSQKVTYALTIQMQIVMCMFATAFCSIGMLVDNDFKAISREAKHYELGEEKYYVVIISSMMIWQCYFTGAIGVVFTASSLLSGIIVNVLLPVTEVLSVIFFREKFQSEKVVALVLSLWGFISYFYGEIKHGKNRKLQTQKTEQAVPAGTLSNNP